MNLMNLLNDCFRSNTSWKFSIIQESNWEWVHIDISFSEGIWNINTSPNWNSWELANLLWASDLLQSPSENDLLNWILDSHPPHRVRGIAPDTNMVIPGIVTNFLKRLPENPHDSNPVLILFARSIQYELHTMRPFTYSKKMIFENESFWLNLFKELPLVARLWNIPPSKGISGLSGIQSRRGRTGLKGTYEIDQLRYWAPVIVVKPAHILHSTRILDETRFLNAVHDSLIRYEIDFIGQNTSLPILFLSNDKDQCKSAEHEGLEALNIRKPFITENVDEIAASSINLERIRALLLSLLRFSPAVRLSSNQGEYFLAWTWRGRHIDDVSDHKIRVVTPEGTIEVITP